MSEACRRAQLNCLIQPKDRMPLPPVTINKKVECEK